MDAPGSDHWQRAAERATLEQVDVWFFAIESIPIILAQFFLICIVTLGHVSRIFEQLATRLPIGPVPFHLHNDQLPSGSGANMSAMSHPAFEDRSFYRVATPVSTNAFAGGLGLPAMRAIMSFIARPKSLGSEMVYSNPR